MSPADAFDPARSALERAGIRYAIGGSWASTAFGEPRFTKNVDIVAEFTEERLRRFLDNLPDDTFYVDAVEARTAIRSGRSFHLTDTGLSKAPASFVTPEDILLAKLYWFRSGGEVSDVQWRDIKGIVSACAATLDRSYLQHGAAQVGVRDLSGKALEEVTQRDRCRAHRFIFLRIPHFRRLRLTRP